MTATAAMARITGSAALIYRTDAKAAPGMALTRVRRGLPCA